MSDRKPHALVWIDTETTAIDPADGQLLEIGVNATPLDDPDTAIYCYQTPIWQRCINLNSDTAGAIRMHMSNGLIDECLDAGGHATTITDVFETLDTDLAVLAEKWVLHPAGTNPDFDVDWIKHTHATTYITPTARTSHRIWQHFNHRKLDMTAIRLSLQPLGINLLDPKVHDTQHRVANCINRDLHEYRMWRRWLDNHHDGNQP